MLFPLVIVCSLQFSDQCVTVVQEENGYGTIGACQDQLPILMTRALNEFSQTGNLEIGTIPDYIGFQANVAARCATGDELNDLIRGEKVRVIIKKGNGA